MTSDKRTAIVTGSSRGIGAAVARRLAEDGFNLLINYVGNADEANAVVKDITGAGGAAIAAAADVSRPDQFAQLFDAAEQAFGGVDVLVNNAGIMKLSLIAETDDALFDQQIAINLKGLFNGVRLGAQRVRDNGRIINFSSSLVGLLMPTYGVYAATKAATEALTHILAKELGHRGIRVNAVAPGPVETHLFMDGKSPELVERTRSMNPLGRLGQPEDIARVVSFLAGPDGEWVNGQVLRVNGGII